MSELGQWLRETRQAKELSLEKVAAETRIRIKFLAALEEGDYDQLPGGIYAQGFLRNYALFLGLDPAEALEKYKERETNRRDKEPGIFPPLQVTVSRPTANRLRNRLVFLILISGLLTAGLWAWKTGRLAWPPPLALFQPTAAPSSTPTPAFPAQPSATATVQAVTAPEFTATPTLRPTLTSTVLIRPTSTPSLTPTATTARPTAKPITTTTPLSPTLTPTLPPLTSPGVTLTIAVTETSWVEVAVDSLNVFRGLMEPGGQEAWEARQEIMLRLGNAGGVQVTVNGESLGVLGERQQVVEFAWGTEGEVKPAPTATATATPETPPETPEASP